MTTTIKATPLHDTHVKLGARMVPFAGWDMPVEYRATGLAKEHIAVRTSTALFDVSHMGRFYLAGPNTLDMLQYVLTNDASQLKPGDAQYSFLVQGGMRTVDDVYLYRLAEEEFLLIVNAANLETDYAYLAPHAKEFNVDIRDLSEQTALVAVQGPASRKTLEQLVGTISVEDPNKIFQTNFGNSEIYVSTTGYTGEFTRHEVLIKSEFAVDLLNALMEAGGVPTGLGARNTARIEAGLLLFGHDITPEVSPVEAGMGFAVRPEKAWAMVGKELYEQQKLAQKTRTLGRYLVQLELSQPRQVERREGGEPSAIIINGEKVGEITSSTVAPMVNPLAGEPYARRGMALGYSSRPISPGTEVGILVRGAGEPVPAVVMRELLDKKTPVIVNGQMRTRPVTHYYN